MPIPKRVNKNFKDWRNTTLFRLTACEDAERGSRVK